MEHGFRQGLPGTFGKPYSSVTSDDTAASPALLHASAPSPPSTRQSLPGRRFAAKNGDKKGLQDLQALDAPVASTGGSWYQFSSVMFEALISPPQRTGSSATILSKSLP